MSWKTATAPCRPALGSSGRPSTLIRMPSGRRRVADHHLDAVGRLAPQRPDQRHLLDRERGTPVRPEQAVVRLPALRAVRRPRPPRAAPGGRVVQQERAGAVDHADPVAEAVHDRAEQPGLAAALGLGGAQLGGGHQHLGPGPGPAGGQDPDQPGEHHGDREPPISTVAACCCAAPGRWRESAPVTSVHCRSATGNVARRSRSGLPRARIGGHPHPPAVAVGGEQLAVEQALAGRAEHAAEEVLAVQAEHDPAAEHRSPGRAGADRARRRRRTAAARAAGRPRSRSRTYVSETAARPVRRASASAAAGLVRRRRCPGRLGPGVVVVQRPVKIEKKCSAGAARGLQHQAGGAAARARRLGRGDPGGARPAPRTRPRWRPTSPAAGQRGGGGVEVGGGEPRRWCRARRRPRAAGRGSGRSPRRRPPGPPRCAGPSPGRRSRAGRRAAPPTVSRVAVRPTTSTSAASRGPTSRRGARPAVVAVPRRLTITSIRRKSPPPAGSADGGAIGLTSRCRTGTGCRRPSAPVTLV